MRRLRILTWHVDSSYLYYLSRIPHELFVPVSAGRPAGYDGLPAGSFPWPANLHQVPIEELRRLPLDCLLFQARSHWEVDQYHLLSAEQRRLPRIYLEHDPPAERSADTRHFIDQPDTLLVHVTPFNALMWDSGRAPTRVIEHGVAVPSGIFYQGDVDRAVAVIDPLRRRERRMGSDVLDAVGNAVPVDLVGRGASVANGLGSIPYRDYFTLLSRYRTFFNATRYTSLEIAVCEAMMLGLPVCGLATTEMATVVQNGFSGYVDTDPTRLATYVRELLHCPGLARRMGENARRYASERFHLGRFVRDWNQALAAVTCTVVAHRPTVPISQVSTAPVALGRGAAA